MCEQLKLAPFYTLWNKTAICIMCYPLHEVVGRGRECLILFMGMNWKLSFANEVRDNFSSSLFMEISYFILITLCLYCPHKMPFLFLRWQIIARRIIHWKVESNVLISRKPINNEWGCYLFVTIPQMEAEEWLYIPLLPRLTLRK